MQYNQLPKIKYGTIPKVLFIGNGINKSFSKPSWDQLISEISLISDDRKLSKIKNIPYPLQPVIVTDDNVDEGVDLLSEKIMQLPMYDEERRLINEFTKLPFDTILTTNYTYEIEKAIHQEFQCKLKSPSKYRKVTQKGNRYEEQFGIYKYMEIPDANQEQRIWHIHGEAARPKSMVFGHYYYGNLLSQMQQYVAKCKAKYMGCQKYKKDYQPYSWIDYFLIGNVYMVGFGLSMSELDIWWLINAKKRNFNQCGKIYYYEPNMNDVGKISTKMLAEAYGVSVKTESVKDNYVEYYHKIAKVIEACLI